MEDTTDIDTPSEFAAEYRYEPHDAIQSSVKSASLTGGAGLLVAAVQNTVQRENVGAFGIFSRYGKTVALFAGMGGAYAFASTASANLREKHDPWNHAWGGFAAGSLIGLQKRTLPAVLGNGLALAVILAGVHVAGGNFLSSPPEGSDDSYMTKEEIRKRFRRPVNEIINEIGEGRGIYPAGYEERRKQRIKEKYGIDIREPYYKS